MRFRFLDCMLDTGRRELRRAGTLMPLRPRVYDLLELLIRERQRAVSKAEIFERIWPKRVVGDATLFSCIKELRKAAGDRARAQRVIQTLHGHGFRFIAPVEVDETAPEPVPDAPGVLPAPRVPVEREHKQVSVLVCELVDADTLATRLGPEAMDEVLQHLLAGAR